MESQDLGLLFAGVDDECLLLALRFQMRDPRNDVQRTFCLAWDAVALVNSDGFEMLLEQGSPLEDYAGALGKIGLPQAEPIFAHVLALIPPHLLLPENQQGLFEHLQSLFEKLKGLAYEFSDASAQVVPIVSHYGRQHRDDFQEYAGSGPEDTERSTATFGSP